MKQETVIKVQMCCDKCRAKAMKVAASVEGVGSLAIKGEDKDHLVVIGENVDPVKLVRSLRKKVGHAEIISLDKSEDNDGSSDGGGGGEDDKPKPESPRCPNYYPYLPPVIYIA